MAADEPQSCGFGDVLPVQDLLSERTVPGLDHHLDRVAAVPSNRQHGGGTARRQAHHPGTRFPVLEPHRVYTFPLECWISRDHRRRQTGHPSVVWGPVTASDSSCSHGQSGQE